MKAVALALVVVLLLAAGVPVRAAPLTLQQRIDAFISTLRGNPWHYTNEPPAVVVDAAGAVVYVSPEGRGPQITLPEGLHFPPHSHLWIFHSPFLGAHEAISPPAPQDVAIAAFYELDSITAVGFDPITGHETLDTFTLKRMFWPDILGGLRGGRGHYVPWVTYATAKVEADAATRHGSWSRRMNAALRSLYGTLYPGWLVYTYA